MTLLFRRTRALEAQIDQFLDAVSEGCLVFEQGVDDYLRGDRASFEERRKAIGVSTSRRSSSALDNVIDQAKQTLGQFEVERPDVPEDLAPDYVALARAGSRATQHLIDSCRAFFRDITAVRSHIHKVYFFEKEADRLADALKRKIFAADLELARKIHLRYFCLHVETISDRAEEVADRLSIYTIKRTI